MSNGLQRKIPDHTDSIAPALIGCRKDLCQVLPKLNENFDKVIVKLVGGALALSLTFIKEIVPPDKMQHMGYLILSWSAFIVILIYVLVALLFGIYAHPKAIKQIDACTIHSEKVGGVFSTITEWPHGLGTAFFVTGFICISIFVYKNMEARKVECQETQGQISAITPPISEKKMMHS